MKYIFPIAITILLIITVLELGAITNIMFKAAYELSTPIVEMEQK